MVPELRVEEPFFAYNAGDPDFIDAFGNTRTIERDSSSMAYSWRERGVWHRERVRPPTGIEALLGDPGVTNFREEIFLSNLASPKTLFDTEAKADGDGNDEIVTMTGITNVKMVAGACIARGSPGNLSIMDKSSGCLFNTLELSGATCAATAGCENDFYDAGSLTATNKAVYAGYVNFGSTTHPMSRPVDVWQWLPATQKWTQLNRPFGVQTRFGTHELLLNDGAKVFVIAPQAPNFWLAAYDDTTPPTLSASVLSTAKYAQQKKFKLKTLTLFTGRGWDAAIDPLTGRILIVYQTLSATGKAGLQGTLCRTDDLSCRDVPKWKTPDSDNAFMPVVRLVRSSFPPFSNVWKVSFWTDAQSPSGDSLRLAQANFISQIGTPPFSSAWALPNYITPCPDDRDPPRWGLGGDYDGTVVLGANTASPVHLRAFTDDQGEGCGPHQTFDRDHAHVSVVELPADISGGAGPFSLSAAAAGSSSTSQTPSQPDSATDGGDEGDSGSADPSEDQGNYHVVLPEVF